MSQANRGVDVDVLCAIPAPPLEELSRIFDALLKPAGFARLKSVDELQLDALMEWHTPDERCIAVAQPAGDALLIYDSHFSHSALADALSRELPGTLLVQVNVQEASDVTLRLLRSDAVLLEYSNAPGFFNWGRCIGKNEPVQLARLDAEQLLRAAERGGDAAVIAKCLQMIASKNKGERRSNGRYSGGVLDAVQEVAAQLKLPRLYRFFEGWMKSNLDWDEDAVRDVFAYRKS